MRLVVAVFFVTLLAVSSIALADNSVQVAVSNQNVILQSGDSQALNVTITNNEGHADTFSLSVFPSFLQGITTTSTAASVNILAGGQDTETIYFTAPFDIQQFVSIFEVTAQSFSTPTVKAAQSIVLQTVRRSPVYVSDIKLTSYAVDPLTNLIIDTKLTNLDNRDYANYTLTTLIMKGSITLQRFDTNVPVVRGKSATDVLNTYTVPQYAEPGAYAVQSTLKDPLGALLSSSSIQFAINPVYKLPAQYTQKTTNIGFVSATITITVINQGNVQAPEFYLTESLPSITDRLFSSSPSPSFSNSTLGSTVYSWYIPALQPGQLVVVQYQISLVPIWITLLFIALGIYVAYIYTFRPSIVKYHRHYGAPSKGKEIPVLIDVKNKSVHEIKDIVVVDQVPQLAELVEKFDTLRPKVKKLAGGVELIWHFDSLKPREERVLTYRIKPIIDARELHMPHARAMYMNRRKQKKFIASRKIVIK